MQRLDGSTTLANGLRVHLRLPHRLDAARLRGLVERAGLPADDLTIARTLRFDPRGRVAVVATALVDRGELLVGIGVIDRFSDELELLLADEDTAPGTAAALESALRAHALHARRIA